MGLLRLRLSLERGMFAIALSLLIQSCSNTATNESATPDWLQNYRQKINPSDQFCPDPVGVFRVDGASSDSRYNYPLQQLLFSDKLAGFPVEAVRINRSAETDALIIRGILDGVALERAVTVRPASDQCELRWHLKVDTGEVDSTLRTEAVLWTGAVIFPLSEFNHLYLQRADDGSLMVHVRNQAWILGALLIPFTVETEFWQKYEGVLSGSGSPE